MSRRRYLSTEISLDPSVDEVAQQSDFAALLYTWMIPHASDDATITGELKKLVGLVIPHRRDKSLSDVSEALALLEGCGLLLWDRETKTIYLPADSFYRYQSYIKADNRRKMPDNSGKRRKTPENASSFSFSVSPSVSTLSPKERERERARANLDAFERAYAAYPVHRYKKRACAAFLAAVESGADPEQIVAACGNTRKTDQTLEFFLADDAWLDAIPKPKRPPCEACCDTGWIENDEGTASPCPECGGAR